MPRPELTDWREFHRTYDGLEIKEIEVPKEFDIYMVQMVYHNGVLLKETDEYIVLCRGETKTVVFAPAFPSHRVLRYGLLARLWRFVRGLGFALPLVEERHSFRVLMLDKRFLK